MEDANNTNLTADKYVATAAEVGLMAENGVDFSVPVGAAKCVGKLDAQEAHKKTIFGRGLLLGRHTAKAYKEAIAKAERAKAERAKEAIVWELSDRERAIVEALEG